MLSFVHLSDIHFHKYSGDNYDVDEDLRNEILLDIKDEFPKYINKTTGVLVCGDVAFSGQKSEYFVAISFLNEILKSLSLSEADVYCVPGNHDVDQNAPKTEPAVYDLQKDLAEQVNQVSYDTKIADIFRGKISPMTLYKTIECYNNNFAAQYSCYFSTDKLYWENSLKINEKYELSIWGINSTIISNADDHKDPKIERKMRLSEIQIPRRRANTIFMTLCHHPPECWVDQGSCLANKLDQRVMVQLYGHKHLQSIRKSNNSIIVGSGAAHPSRKEPDWLPRYNWITLDIENIYGTEYLVVRIYPRIWNGDKFVCDSKNCINSCAERNVFSEYKLILNLDTFQADEQMIERETKMETKEITKNKIDTSWQREFVYDFINLPFLVRCSILDKYGLCLPEDEGKKHTEFIADIIQRAEAKNCVHALITEVNKKRENL